MGVTRDDDAERKARADELLRKLRKETDASQEERRVISESMSQSATTRGVDSKRANSRAIERPIRRRERQ